MLTAPVQIGDLAGATAMVAGGIGGVVLYGGPPDSRTAAGLQALHVAAGRWRLLVASDEEGGGIQRLAAVTTVLPWPRTLAAAGPATVRARAADLGRRLAAIGVDVDLAPVADLDAGPGPDAQHPDGKRSFSADPAAASADVVAFATGLQSAGVVAVVKHFPGLGTATGNTDDVPATTAPLPALRGRDLRPFAAAVSAGVGGVMLANAVVPGLAPGPVVLTPEAVALLRGQLGFRGAVFTDSVSAKALGAAGIAEPEAAVRALLAGADDVVFGTDLTRDGPALAARVRAGVVAAVQQGRLPDARLRDAATRVATALGQRVC